MLEMEQMRGDIPDFKPGDTVKVHARIKEGEKERIQVFSRGCYQENERAEPAPHLRFEKSLTVSAVERIFPLHSPNIDKVEGGDKRESEKVAAVLS